MDGEHDAEPNLAELFAPFLAANPDAKIAKISRSGKEVHVIEKPWNDDTIIIPLEIAPELEALAGALNHVVLPQRFSAIWHSDTKDLEVIWTAFKLSQGAEEIAQRRFTFTIDGSEYVCEYNLSSDRLLAIAKAAVQIRSGETNFRNLASFNMYQREIASGAPFFDKPRSFWIRKLDWDEDKVVDLAHHINFYMSYFDDRTGKIIIHPTAEVSTVKPQHRYIAGAFPLTIRAKVIDPNVLHFWGAAHGADDQSKSFLYYYRLIEYASTTHIEGSARASVQRLLAAPNALDDIPAIVEQLLLAAQSTKKEDEQKVVHLLVDTIDRKVLIREIENNIESFCKETKFEGGFTLDPLISGQKADNLDISKFAKHIKDIRNALSHGRDIRTQQVIIPTKRNFDLLQPWVTLMCLVAGQVVLFRGIGNG